MAVYWFQTGEPVYPSMDSNQNIAYISDVGAYTLKPLFITGSVIATVLLDASFFAERWLRHTGRLARNTSRAQRILGILSIVFAIIGSIGMILLAVFDTFQYSTKHNIFLLVFIAGYTFSAIFICADYQRLGIHYRQHRILRISFWVKLAFILIEVALAVAFGVMSFTRRRNVGAVLEWVIAIIFAGYILSFLLDLYPSVRTKRRKPQGELEIAETADDTGHGYGRDGADAGVNGAATSAAEQHQQHQHQQRGKQDEKQSKKGKKSNIYDMAQFLILTFFFSLSSLSIF